ncbi:MAG TPA: ketopantoate reductase family protein [Steroidobacteraceae bacterium]
MRILVLGAGGIGGYFGGQLLAAGRDVTFLVRSSRAQQLRQAGLHIHSDCGDVHLVDPPTLTAEQLRTTFDLILLSCKAYDLESALQAIAPALASSSRILPLLNGMAHLDRLDARFGRKAVFGGQCMISVTPDAEGHLHHYGVPRDLTFGSRDSAVGEVRRAAAALADAGFNLRISDHILQEMWEKWAFIAALAGITCLMRANIGDIAAAGAAEHAAAILREAGSIAALNGYSPSPESQARSITLLTMPGSALTASMFRDLQGGRPIEADHILDDLLRRAGNLPAPLLSLAAAQLRAYEIARLRLAAARR